MVVRRDSRDAAQNLGEYTGGLVAWSSTADASLRTAKRWRRHHRYCGRSARELRDVGTQLRAIASELERRVSSGV